VTHECNFNVCKRMSLPEYIAAIGEESPAQELVCDDNLTKYNWDSPTFIYSLAQIRICTIALKITRYQDFIFLVLR
jgi:hypothetical protein